MPDGGNWLILLEQFCANDPEQLLFCAKALEPHCDAVDLNLGCPQEIARRGYYGSFLQEDWDLIFRLSEQFGLAEMDPIQINSLEQSIPFI